MKFKITTFVIVALTAICLAKAQSTNGSLVSPWKQVGKQIEFNTRSANHTMSPDGKLAAWIIAKEGCDTCNQDVVLYDVLTGKEQRITPPPSPETKRDGYHDVQSLRFSPDSIQLAAVICLPRGETCRIDLYNSKDGTRGKEWRFRMHEDFLHSTNITEFTGNRITVMDEMWGIYTIDGGKLINFVKTKSDSRENPHDKMGSLRIWTEPKYKEGLASVFGPSILHGQQ